MKSELARVLLVDDHAVVRLGLRTLIEATGAFQVVGEAGTAEEAIRLAAETKPDVVVMDIRLPDRSGIEACRDIRAENQSVQVLMLTSYPDEEAVLSSVLAGASGYLLKEIDPDKLLNALHVVAQGGSLLSPHLVRRVVEQAREEARASDDVVTAQDLAILDLVARGKTNREIGGALYLSENTVKHYVSRLLAKLNLGRRSEAAAYWVKRQKKQTGDIS